MYRSLCIVALFAFSASALTVRESDPISPAEEKCKVENKITPEMFKTISGRPELAFENPKTRCYAACVLTENKTMKPDGTFNVEYLETTIPKNIPDRAELFTAFNDCSKEKGKDSCETAFKSATCLNAKPVIKKMHH